MLNEKQAQRSLNRRMANLFRKADSIRSRKFSNPTPNTSIGKNKPR